MVFVVSFLDVLGVSREVRVTSDLLLSRAPVQWDFQGPPIMGPLTVPILFPYHSHKNPWEWYGNSM